jgi:hypothetical protein
VIVPPRLRRCLLAAVAALACWAAPAQADAGRDVEICARKAAMYESPGGAAVGVVWRGDRVVVLHGGAGRRWWRIRARFGTRGWIRASAVCAEDR